MKNMVTCSVCGSENKEWARFCKECGARLLPTQEIPSEVWARDKIWKEIRGIRKEIEEEEEEADRKMEELRQKKLRDKHCCFIATCALPSQHSDLNYLRDFRDEVLKPTKLGRLIVWIYYALSPPIALMVCASKRMKRLVRKRFIPFWIRICKEWEEQKKNTKG